MPILGQLVWGGLAATASVAFILAFAVGAGAQVWRYHRRSSVAERQATKWLLLGLIPALGVFLGLGLLSLLPAPGAGLLAHPWYAAAATVAMWVVPVAGTVGLIVREHGPVDPLVVAVVAVTGTTVGVAAAYSTALSLGSTPGWATVAACLGATLAPSERDFPGLTARERQVLGLVADGQSNAQIADTLAVSGKTVANYVSALLISLHARDRTHLAELVNTRRPSPSRPSPTSGNART